MSVVFVSIEGGKKKLTSYTFVCNLSKKRAKLFKERKLRHVTNVFVFVIVLCLLFLEADMFSIF